MSTITTLSDPLALLKSCLCGIIEAVKITKPSAKVPSAPAKLMDRVRGSWPMHGESRTAVGPQHDTKTDS